MGMGNVNSATKISWIQRSKAKYVSNKGVEFALRPLMLSSSMLFARL